MPPSRHRIPPQTSKKARKTYIKANKHFEFTPTQARASERRLELDKRAKALQAKEQRKRDNKRKREEKEAAELEAKRKRIENGKAPIEALWGKVHASQRRLNAFFAQPKAADKEEVCRSDSEDEASLAYDYDLGHEVTDHLVEQTAHDSAADTKDLEVFFSSPPFENTPDKMQTSESDARNMPAQSAVGELAIDAQSNKNTATSQSEDYEQALNDAQFALSQGISDFDIAEDDDAEWMPIEAENVNQSNVWEGQSMHNRSLATPSKRKAEEADFEFTSPAKSARSALSEMSPSKVNIRAQEKPDILSVASSAAKLPTPSPTKQASRQSPADMLALIATQDLEDDEFATDKENEDPWQAESTKRLQKDDNSQKENDAVEGDVKRDTAQDHRAAKQTQVQSPPYDEDIFDDDDFADLASELEDGYDDYDKDLDDEALAALAAKSPSAHKLALLSTKTAAVVSFPPQQPSVPATEGNSFAFDDLQDDDLATFADELDAGDLSAVPGVDIKTKPSRTILWKHPSPFATSPGSDEPLSQDEDPPYD